MILFPYIPAPSPIAPGAPREEATDAAAAGSIDSSSSVIEV